MEPRYTSHPPKAGKNLRKHKVSFEEAMTIFDDPLSSTLPDDQHSWNEQRWITVGMSARGRVLFVVYTENESESASSARDRPMRRNMPNTKKSELDPLAPRPNLDFSKGVRGKYNNLLAEGTNVAIIDPALVEHFPNSESVNQALRAFLDIQERMKAARAA